MPTEPWRCVKAISLTIVWRAAGASRITCFGAGRHICGQNFDTMVKKSQPWTRSWDQNLVPSSVSSMQDIAEIIVNKARMMPVDIGVALESNGATIAKVKVTGGFGLQVTSQDRALLFPMAELPVAVQSFLAAALLGGKDNISKFNPTVRHTNGVPLLRFEWH
eukprot:7391985-Prymnesium_polylepis.1